MMCSVHSHPLCFSWTKYQRKSTEVGAADWKLFSPLQSQESALFLSNIMNEHKCVFHKTSHLMNKIGKYG